jgi:hypothetical protein
VGKPVGNSQLGSPRHRRRDNIKMYLLKMGWGRDWIVLAQKKIHVAGSCKRGNEPSCFIKRRGFLDCLRTC